MRGSGPHARHRLHGRTFRYGLKTWKVERGRYRYFHQLQLRIKHLLEQPSVLAAWVQRLRQEKEVKGG